MLWLWESQAGKEHDGPGVLRFGEVLVCERRVQEVKDKYDEAVDYLTKNPEEIYQCWNHPISYRAGALFLPVSDKLPASPNTVDLLPRRGDGLMCGCLTMVRAGLKVAWTDELTEAIRGDARIPKTPESIKPEHLPVFAEWQRRIDKELGRE